VSGSGRSEQIQLGFSNIGCVGDKIWMIWVSKCLTLSVGSYSHVVIYSLMYHLYTPLI